MSSWSNKAKQPPKSYAADLNSSPESNMVSLKMSRKANKKSNSPMLPNLPSSLDLPASANPTNWANAEPFVPAAANSMMRANAEPFVPAAANSMMRANAEPFVPANLSQKKENAANMNSYLKEINMKRNLNQQNNANMNSYLMEINNVRNSNTKSRKNRKTRSASRKASRKSKKSRRHH